MSADRPAPQVVFVDTNIWLYAFSDTQNKQKTQQAKAVIHQTPHIALSTQIINEVCVNLLRKFQADETDVQKLIRTFYRKYLVIGLSLDILLQASDLRITYEFSYWDSIVVASALAAGANVLYSEDMHDGLTVNNQLTISNPL